MRPEPPAHAEVPPALGGAPVFLRFGRDHMQPLLETIGNPRLEVADADVPA
ncbi:hypothetical protein [Streptomyces sp. H27-C3]|uniref:hypothetical protein n=1 Tax=Streptomyces sp. H27-C3 TaxID=3046305 RepID=UPI0024B8D6FC|nr:hypothetical protein [Streptomyces sp. H27-C3]MDJ0465498.1 hypothetical protein [Streptomyces sp. H27-C3]